MSVLAVSERQLQEQVVALARATGWVTYHTFDSRRSAPGFPDLVLAHIAVRQVVFAELKAQSGRVTPAQQWWLDALDKADDVKAHLWRPSDWDEIEAVLTAPRTERRGK